MYQTGLGFSISDLWSSGEPTTEVPAGTTSGSSWWDVAKDVLKTGADVYATVKGKAVPPTSSWMPAPSSPSWLPQTTYPSPYPQTPTAYFPQLTPPSQQPAWLIPALALGGGVLLITMLNKR